MACMTGAVKDLVEDEELSARLRGKIKSLHLVVDLRFARGRRRDKLLVKYIKDILADLSVFNLNVLSVSLFLKHCVAS